jgi:hypothetical protein
MTKQVDEVWQQRPIGGIEMEKIVGSGIMEEALITPTM